MLRIGLFACMMIPGLVHAQSDHAVCKTIPVSRSEIVLDSLTVIPESIVFSELKDVGYHYDPNTGMIYFDAGSYPDSLEVCYQTIPYQLHKTYQRKDLAVYNEQMSYSSAKAQEGSSVLDRRVELFPTDNLQKNGSISRGISFGNTQDVVVNSALNLQIEGKLGDDLNIRASVTDQNLPFQPEGNTAQIQDFDNVFIELYNDQFSLKGGDIVFKNKASEFLRYYKDVQGGIFDIKYKIGENSSAQTDLGISIAKGKFATVQIEPEEGVSGPYRIVVPNTNEFIIILANSEKVYLDGVQLKRGFNYDYVIDYNKSEIQFTGKVLITKYSRIRIDVEYADQNYSRSIVTASHYQDIGKANFSFNYYSEKDNKNNPLTFNLTNADKRLLSDIGDDLNKAVKLSAQEVEFNQNEILYELVDTLDNALNPVEVFRYTTNPDEIVFRVLFTELGQGRGDYILTNTTTNGRVFQWISPENGIPQGSYAPISKFPAPNKKQMVTLGGGIKLSKYEKVFAETAFSDNDLNLYSDLDEEDDNGFAVKGGISSERRPVSFLKNYYLTAATDYEFDNANFKPIDRYRYIEFNRDWNYTETDSNEYATDHILNAEIALEKNALNRIAYKFVKRRRETYVDGIQQYFDLAQEIGNLQIFANTFFLRNTTGTFNSFWNKISAEAEYKTKLFVPGYRLTIDENEVIALNSDSVISTNNYYTENLFFINSNDSLKTKFGISYALRNDQNPVDGVMTPSNRSQTTQLFVNSDFSANQILNFLLTYRNNLNYLAPGGPKNEETLIVRSDWYANFFKRHVRSDLTYAIGSSRELVKEFVFVPVPTGEGTHTWRDDNGDGAQDLTEFYIAVNPDEKNYIKIWVPTNEYIFAYENSFNYRLNIDLPRTWKELGGFKKLLSKLSAASSWNIVKRITSDDLAARILPFYSDIPEEDLLALKETIRSRVFYNRSNSGLGIDFGYLQSDVKQLMTQGFEQSNRSEYSTNARLNVSKTYSLKLLYLWGTNTSSSDYLAGRNFSIDRFKIMPEVAWQPSTNFRFSLFYGYTDKVNTESEQNETAKINELTANLRWSKAANLSLDAFMKYSEIQFNGNVNTPVAYDMLDALQPGQNYSWSIILQKKILMGLQLSLNYEGRKSENADAIHIGRMQVSALF